MQPLVSIVIPTYNRKSYLRETLQSVVNQTYRNLEVIVVDNFSNYNFINLIESFGDDRIIAYQNKNNGNATVNRNLGLTKINGQYVAMCDDDDIFLPTKIEEQVEIMEGNENIALCGTWTKNFGAKNMVAKVPDAHKAIQCFMLFSSPSAHSSMMFRKSFLDKYNLKYNIQMKYTEDYELPIKIFELKGEFVNIPKALVKYRIHTEQLTNEGNNNFENERIIGYKRMLASLSINPTDQEIEIHRKIGRYNFFQNSKTSDKEIFKNINKWLSKISNQNKKLKVFDNFHLNQLLFKKLVTTTLYRKKIDKLILSEVLFGEHGKNSNLKLSKRISIFLCQCLYLGRVMIQRKVLLII